MYSTSTTLTLLNLYGTPSESFFVTNDASTIENMDQYRILIIDSDKKLNGTMVNVNNKNDSWFTFIFNQCATFFLESITFDSKYKGGENGYLEIQEMTPTQKLQPMIKYPYSPNTYKNIHRLIPSQIATFHVQSACIHFSIKPNYQQVVGTTSASQSASSSMTTGYAEATTRGASFLFSASSFIIIVVILLLRSSI